MQRWLGFAVIGGAFAWLSGGCSSASAPYPDTGSFCAAVGTAQCQSPDGGLGIPSLCGVSGDQCASAVTQACLASASAATAGGTRTYTQANAPACIAATLMTYSGSAITYASLQSAQQACDAVFEGTIPIGGTCTSSESCSQGAEAGPGTVVCSPISPGSAQMQCATATPVAANGFCANPGDVCAAGTYCTGQSATSAAKCEPGGGIGASCTAAVGCQVGAYCNISPGAKTGSCIAGGQAGSACSSDANCGPSAPFCDPNVKPPTGANATGSCEAGLTFAVGADDCQMFGAATR